MSCATNPTMRFALVVLVCAACGDSLLVPVDATPTSGARLRLVWHEFADDARQLDATQLFDSERDEYCAPTAWSDGTTHCSPPAPPAVFTDAACSQLVGSVVTREPPIVPAYFYRPFIVRNEPLVSRLYPTGAPVAAPVATWELRDGVCIGPRTADPARTYFALGEELTSAAFAQVRHEDSPLLRDRLALTVLTSSDGMRLPITERLHDEQLAAPCTITSEQNTTLARCVPEATTATYYSDFACTTPIVAVPAASERPTYAAVRNTNHCVEYKHAGAPLSVGAVFYRGYSGCVATIPPEGTQFFAVGESLDVVTLTRTRGTGARLAPIALGLGDTQLEDTRLYDTQLGIECERRQTADGERCLPLSPYAAEPEQVFRDEACTESFPVVLIPDPVCSRPGHVVTASAAGVEVRPVIVHDDTMPWPIYHLSTGKRCLSYLWPANYKAFELGAPLPLDTFARATTVID